MRTFSLYRDEDLVGISGTGTVAEGVIFNDGSVVLSWLKWGTNAGGARCVVGSTSKSFWFSVDDMLAVHGHGGKTRILFDDNFCSMCGAPFDLCRVHCFSCGSSYSLPDKMLTREERYEKHRKEPVQGADPHARDYHPSMDTKT